jgi:endonuclease/exonuclease/phosphatase family metal-dependent hydrolase
LRQPAEEPGVIRLLSHNVDWFQGHPFQGDRPGAVDDRVLRECVRLYRRLQPNVLCLQEIQSASAAAAVGAALAVGSQYLAGGDFPQYGGCVLSDAAVPVASPGELRPARIWQRFNLPVAGLLGSPLRCVNVHSPSDRQLGAASQTQRLSEFRAGLAESPPVDVILGDFNERPGLPMVVASSA